MNTGKNKAVATKDLTSQIFLKTVLSTFLEVFLLKSSSDLLM